MDGWASVLRRERQLEHLVEIAVVDEAAASRTEIRLRAHHGAEIGVDMGVPERFRGIAPRNSPLTMSIEPNRLIGMLASVNRWLERNPVALAQ